jgi:arylsulfatase A-like enzyme
VGTVEDILSLHEREELNVIFVLIDTLRADRLSSFGYERETSPRLDALADSGVRFNRHLSQSSWTKCSMASMWTGLYPNRSGVLRSRHALPDGALMPAEIFREAGYRTTAIYRNGWVAPNFGFAQGFEIDMLPAPPSAVVQQIADDPSAIAQSDGDVIRAATGFLRSHADDPFFMYLHLLDVHQYGSDDASAVFGTTYSDIYDNAILWTDSLIGHLIDEVERRGIRDRTLIVVASDHGEAFGEHGKDGHAYDVYGEVTQVPFIVSFPFRLEQGIVVDSPSENVDIWPTILDLIGMSPLEDPDGTSLLPAVEAAASGESSPDEGTLRFAHLDHTWAGFEGEPDPIVSVTENEWRMIYQGEERMLFDKNRDPREQTNLASERPEVVTSMTELVEDYLSTDDAPWPEEALSIEIDDMELNQLRALGYGVK